MKALTVHQPWAWAIIYADKVENRTWGTSYRGPVLIHAGATWDEDGAVNDAVIEAAVRASPADERMIRRYGVDRQFEGYVRGAIIGVADLVDVHPCRRLEDGTGCCDPWGEQEYVETRTLAQRPEDAEQLPAVQHWVWDNRRPLAKPIPCRGWLQLWTPTSEVLAHIREQLPS